MSWFIVSLHDVAPTTIGQSREWSRLLDPLGVRSSLLVIPGPWNGGPAIDAHDERARAAIAWVAQRVAIGDEVVQHGWEHAEAFDQSDVPVIRRVVGRVLARGCAELWSTDAAETRRRVHLGFRTMQRVGLCPTGFVAPGWLIQQSALRTLSAYGFRHTSTHLEVRSLGDDRRWKVPVLSQRSLSLAAPSAARTTTSLARALITMRRPFRLALHPDDLFDPHSRRAGLRIAEAAVRAGYRSITYAALVQPAPLTRVGRSVA